MKMFVWLYIAASLVLFLVLIPSVGYLMGYSVNKVAGIMAQLILGWLFLTAIMGIRWWALSSAKSGKKEIPGSLPAHPR